MALVWDAVIAKPEFQQLSDTDKSNAANQYFNDVVAPQIDSSEASDAASQFSQYSGFKIESGVKEPPSMTAQFGGVVDSTLAQAQETVALLADAGGLDDLSTSLKASADANMQIESGVKEPPSMTAQFGGAVDSLYAQAQETGALLTDWVGLDDLSKSLKADAEANKLAAAKVQFTPKYGDTGFNQLKNILDPDWLESTVATMIPGSAPFLAGASAGFALAPPNPYSKIVGAALGGASAVALQEVGPAYYEYLKAHPKDEDGAVDYAIKKAGLTGIVNGLSVPAGVIGYGLGPLKHAIVQMAVQSTVGISDVTASNKMEQTYVDPNVDVTRGMAQAGVGEALFTAPAITGGIRAAMKNQAPEETVNAYEETKTPVIEKVPSQSAPTQDTQEASSFVTTPTGKVRTFKKKEAAQKFSSPTQEVIEHPILEGRFALKEKQSVTVTEMADTQATDTTVQPEQQKTPQTPESVEEAVTDETRKPEKPSNNIIQRIKQLGGINIEQIADVTSEQKQSNTGTVGLFRKGAQSLDKLAVDLQSEGFDIDTDSVDGGIESLTNLLQKAIGGEAVLNAFGHTEAAEKEIAKQYRAEVVEKARAIGVRVVGRTLTDIEAAIIDKIDSETTIEADSFNDDQALDVSELTQAAKDVIAYSEIETELSRISSEYDGKPIEEQYHAIVSYLEGVLNEEANKEEVRSETGKARGENNGNRDLASKSRKESKGQQQLITGDKPQVSPDPIKLKDSENTPIDKTDPDSLFGAKERAEAAESNAKTAETLSKVADKLDAVVSRLDKSNSSDSGFVVAPNGSNTFGVISDDIGKEIGRESGEIRLPEGDAKSGLEHIEDRHGDEAANAQSHKPAPTIAISEKPANKYSNTRRFSRAAKPGKGMAVKAMASKVKELSKRWKNSPPIEVVESVSDLPFDAPADVEGAFYRGKVWLVAVNLPTAKRMQEVILHEVFGHHAPRELMGHEWNSYLDSVYQTRKAEVDKLSSELDIDTSDTDGQRHASDEFIAKIAESSAPKHKRIIARAIKVIRNWLRKNGFTLNMSDSDIMGLIAEARNLVESGNRGAETMGEVQPAFSKKETSLFDTVRKGWQLLTTSDNVFSYADSSAKSIKGIAAEVDDALAVKELDNVANVDHVWEVTMTDGQGAAVFDSGNRVWINATSLKSGVSGGSKLYHIVATYAHNNGKVFVADPAGLSNKAMYRRLENMVSTALRYGTTDHIRPHPKQVKGMDSGQYKIEGLDWKDGDSAHNLEEMLRVSYAYITDRVPSAKHLAFDFEAGVFYDTQVQRDDGRGIQEIPEKRWTDANKSARARQAGIGSKTIKRAVITHTILREARQGRRHDLLESIAQSRDSKRLKGILYSRAEHDSLVSTAKELIKGKAKGIRESAYYVGKQIYFRPVQVIRDIGTDAARTLSDLIYKEERHEKRAVKGHDLIQRRSKAEGKYGQQLSDLLNKLNKKDSQHIVTALNSEKGTIPKRLLPQFKEARKLLDDIQQYMVEADVDISYIENYFPRMYDTHNLLKSSNRTKFINMLRDQGYENPESIYRRIVENDGFLIHDEQDQRIDIDNYGRATNRILHEGKAGKVAHEKERKLDIPFKELEPFLVNDFGAIMSRYITHSTRRAEYARTFGANENILNGLVAEIVEDYAQGDVDAPFGVRTAVEGIYGLADSLQGRNPRLESDKANEIVRAIANLEIMIHLPLVAFASLPETFAPALQGGMRHYPWAFAKAVRDGLYEATRAVDKLVTRKHHWKSSDMRREAEMMGVVSQHALNEVWQERFGGTTSKLTSKFMRITMLEQLTNIQRITAYNMAKSKIARLSKKSTKQAVMELRDFGLEPGAEYSEEDISYAAQRWAQRVITTPNEATTPELMKHPVGSLIFQFKRFITVFSNTLLKSILQNIKRYPNWGAKAQLIVPAILMVAVAYYAQYMRDWFKYGEAEPDFRKLKDTKGRIMDAVDRSGLTGNLSTLYMLFNPYRYGFSNTGAKVGFNLLGPAAGDAAKTYDILTAEGKSAKKRRAKAIARLVPIVNAIAPTRNALEKALK